MSWQLAVSSKPETVSPISNKASSSADNAIKLSETYDDYFGFKVHRFEGSFQHHMIR